MPNDLPGELPSLPVEQRTRKRTDELCAIQQWCLERMAQLERQGNSAAARCLKCEHLELLRQPDSHRTLWMRIEYDPEG